MSSGIKNIKVIPLDTKSGKGKTRTSYMKWSREHLALAKCVGTKKHYSGDWVYPTMKSGQTTLDETQREQAEKAEAAHARSLLAMKDSQDKKTVDQATTAELPDGCPAKAWKKLRLKHCPETAAGKSELDDDFKNLKLAHAGQNPGDWISDMIDVQCLLQKVHNKSEREVKTDILGHVFTNILFDDYDSLIDDYQKRLKKNEDVSLDDVQDELQEHFDRAQHRKGLKKGNNKNGNHNNDDDGETALNTGGGGC